ncbi:hydroxysteroid 11-beta-dehydrogenase 1-like protein isoform X8 [Physeter macrocephalus]|uniref:Hydroxysteroid 11-beta-dehydrogenase 1-like protein n=1 Tax=Physeter macrocephalus TaxID=9755 RepID=A0A455CB77_PHYMC|nr:hydroxysteroid 11-beta-dehydrogenase 1-like protein isoform X8 [Physeter catodon]|eukprot:XP_028355951.1 hydroxysteroid 11-beta-dehydrogenase 1-like protein isoform X4 [Physeter catodon]
MMTWTRWWLWRWRRGGRARGITTGSSNKDTVGEMGVTGVRLWAGPVPATLSPAAGPGRAMKVLFLAGLGALFFAYYWDDNFDPASLQGARVLLTGASVGVGEELAYHYARLGSHLVLTAHTEALLQKVNFLSYMQLTSSALPSLTDSKGSLVVVSSLLGRVPPSFSSPYSAAKFALGSFFGSLRRELDVQDVNVAITMCVLGLRDRASAAEGVRGVTRAKAAPGPKAALAVIRGSATRASGVFYPWRFHLLGLLRGWMPQPRAWFIRQELNITTPAAA